MGVFAAEDWLAGYKLQIPIGNTTQLQPIKDCPNNEYYCVTFLSEYLATIYNYAVGVIGIIIVVVLMVAGFIRITAGDNAGRIQQANDYIKSALTGTLLLFFSVTILSLINPDLTRDNQIVVKKISGISQRYTDTPIDANGSGRARQAASAGQAVAEVKCQSIDDRDGNDNNAADFDKVLQAVQPSPDLISKCSRYDTTFKNVEQANGLPANLLKALAMHESACDPVAQNTSSAGGTDCGIMQVRVNASADSAECQKLKSDPGYAIEEAAKRLIQNCGGKCRTGNTSDMVAAYNGGSQAVTTSNDCGNGVMKYECCINSGEYGTITQKEIGNVVPWQKALSQP